MNAVRTHKTCCPFVYHHVPRTELINQLAQTAIPVTAVIAPPGFGKTTFVSHYIESLQGISLWYCVDDGDADLASFFHYFSRGIIDLSPTYGGVIPGYQVTDALNIKAFARRYFSSVYQRLDQPFHIVFDDVQECQAQQWADVVGVAIDELPLACRMILVSRETLPAEFARLKVNQKIHTIDENSLRFNNQELAKLASLNNIPALTLEKSKQIQETMKGWAAGLTLLFSNADFLHQDALLAVDTKQDLFDYFANEVLRNLSTEVHDVLYRSCFLKDISAVHAIKLAANPAAGDILQELYKRNYFIYRVDDGEKIFRFHPLFKSFLVTQSQKNLNTEILREIQQKSFTVLVDDGALAEAASLLIDSTNWAQLIRFTIQYAQELVTSNRISTLSKWLQHIPETMIEESSWLLFWRAICILPIRPKFARKDLIKAFELFSAADGSTGQCLCLSGIIDSYVYERDDFFPLDPWIAHVDDLEKTVLSQVSPHAIARLSISMFTALSHRSPNHPRIDAWLKRVQNIPSSALPPFLDVKRKIYIILHYLWQGDYRSAEMHHTLLLNKMQDNNDPITKILSQIIHCCVLWMSLGDCKSALMVAKQGLKEAKNYAMSVTNISLLSHGAAAALMMGDTKEAGNFLQSAACYEDESQRTHLVFYYLLHAVHSYQCSDIEAAFQHSQNAVRYAFQVGIPFFETSAKNLLAQFYFVKGDIQRATQTRIEANAMALQTNNYIQQFNAQLFGAILDFFKGHPEVGLRSAGNALRLAKQYKLLPGLWVCNDELSEVLVESIRNGIESEYAHYIIDKRGLVPREPPYDIADWVWPIRITTLGRFEISINGQLLKPFSRSRPKVYSLLKTLIAFGGENVREELISETVWPDSDGDTAHQIFDTTLFRLRKLLGQSEAIINREGKLSLNRKICWLDTWALDASAEKLVCIGKNRSDNNVSAQIAHYFHQLNTLYTGDFLHAAEQLPIVIQKSVKIRKKWTQAIYIVIDYWTRNHSLKDAEVALEALIASNPIEEKAYCLMMNLYISQGRYSAAAVVYENCVKALKLGLGVIPSTETKLILAKIKKTDV